RSPVGGFAVRSSVVDFCGVWIRKALGWKIAREVTQARDQTAAADGRLLAGCVRSIIYVPQRDIILIVIHRPRRVLVAHSTAYVIKTARALIFLESHMSLGQACCFLPLRSLVSLGIPQESRCTPELASYDKAVPEWDADGCLKDYGTIMTLTTFDLTRPVPRACRGGIRRATQMRYSPGRLKS